MVYVVTHKANGTVCAHSLTQDGALKWIEDSLALFGDAKSDFQITAHVLV